MLEGDRVELEAQGKIHAPAADVADIGDDAGAQIPLDARVPLHRIRQRTDFSELRRRGQRAGRTRLLPLDEKRIVEILHRSQRMTLWIRETSVIFSSSRGNSGSENGLYVNFARCSSVLDESRLFVAEIDGAFAGLAWKM